MNEWLKKVSERIKGQWASWGMAQKLILIGVAVATDRKSVV